MTELTADYQNDWQVRDPGNACTHFRDARLLATSSGEPEKVRERAAEIIKRVRANNKQLSTRNDGGVGKATPTAAKAIASNTIAAGTTACRGRGSGCNCGPVRAHGHPASR